MIASEEVLATRRELRKRSLAGRDAVTAETRHIWSHEIIACLEDYLGERNVRSVHCYLSFRSEVETREFIEEVLEKGIRVTVPVIERVENTAQAVNERLAHAEIQDMAELVKGRFGIDEPAVRSIASLERLDAVIVPLVAFDRNGTRLGYGKGFYDLFLHELPLSVERIGLAFSTQEVEFIPPLPHDERLHTIITEREVIQASTNATA